MSQADVKPIERGAVISRQLAVADRGVTAQEMARLCGVSEWTARRDLETLARVMPIVAERRGREIVWRIMKE